MTPTSDRAADRPWQLHVRAIVAGTLVIAGYLLLLGYRRDYAGHAIAGYAGALGLLSLALLGMRRGVQVGWTAPTVCVGAVLLGVATEATVFFGAVWDPVDFGNQSAGACLAGCVVVGRRAPGVLPALLLGVLALVFMVAGFVLALG